MKNQLIYGTMGLGADETKTDAYMKAIETALNNGIKVFDFANIYQLGKSEEVFGRYLKNHPNVRNDIIIQSKVGIELDLDNPWNTNYNYDYDHIVKEVYKILDRLGIEYLDRLFLHRFDPILNEDYLKKAIDKLFEENLVKKIGVSNMNHFQLKYLENVIDRKIEFNQFEMSLNKLDWLESLVMFNHEDSNLMDITHGTLEYCKSNNIELQSWGSLAQGIYSGKKLKNPNESVLKTKKLVKKISQKKNVSQEAVVLAFLLKSPFDIKPIIGTTTPERINKSIEASTVDLSRKEWYKLFVTSRGKILP